MLGTEVTHTLGISSERQMLIPAWWSEKMLTFVRELERRVHVSILAQHTRGPRRQMRVFVPSDSFQYSSIPSKLPRDIYHESFFNSLLPHQVMEYDPQPPIFPANVVDIFPASMCAKDTTAQPNTTPTHHEESIQSEFDAADQNLFGGDDDGARDIGSSPDNLQISSKTWNMLNPEDEEML